MKISILASAFALATLAAAQGLDQLPPCAVTCATGNLASTGCSLTDFACICDNDEWIEALIPCMQQGCSPGEFSQAATGAQGFCSAAGAPLPSSLLDATATATATPTPSSTSVSNATTTGNLTTTEGDDDDDDSGAMRMAGSGILAAAVMGVAALIL